MKKNTLKRVAALITGIALSFTSSVSAGAVENDEPYLGYVDSRVAIQNPYGNGETNSLPSRLSLCNQSLQRRKKLSLRIALI